MKPDLSNLLKVVGSKRYFLVVDGVLNHLYPDWIKALEAKSQCIGAYAITAKEHNKTLNTLSSLLEALLDAPIHRDDLIIAVGGGIVTDVAGLAAHLVKRGVAWVAVPTTVLGMIDAAIGGKTGIDSKAGKNLIGAFHLPTSVIVEPAFLCTLPEREWINGLGEAIKYALIAKPELLEPLCHPTNFKDVISDHLEVFKGIKEAIVERDPHESHERMFLNLGHTLGHCLERHFDYTRFAHGEAVLYGLYWSLLVSVKYAALEPQVFNQYAHWLCSKPWYEPEVLLHPEWFLSGLQQDKKIRGGNINFVLIEKPGKPVVHPFSLEELTALLMPEYLASKKENLLFHPRTLKGELIAPPSKSDSHRAIIAGAMAALSGSSDGSVSNLIYSDDVEATLNAMSKFGLAYEKSAAGVTFLPSKWQTPLEPIDCKESGSTLRFTIPLSQLVDGPVTYTGINHLKKRPLNDYLRLFDTFNVKYSYSGELPITLQRGELVGDIVLAGNVSSQYFSGLFFTLPLKSEPSTIQVSGDLESKGYVDMTLDTLSKHGVSIENVDYKTFLIPSNQQYCALHYTVEGDYSNAAFWMIAGQIAGGVRIKGLKKNSLQRDKEAMDVILAMGGNIYWEGDDLLSMPSKTYGTEIDAREIPDIIPILCVLASLSEGKTIVKNGERLRVKESDRILSTVTELKALGALIDETDDGMITIGQPMLKGGSVKSWNDHRIAMAMAVASSRCVMPVYLQGAQAVKKSYPHFYEDFQRLGGVYV